MSQASPASSRDAGSACARFGVGFALMAVLCGQSVTCGDKVRVLTDDCEALQARIDLIQQATEQICVASFILDTGEVPCSLMELMRQARQRDVRVRLLVDGLVSRLPVALEQFLACNQIEIRAFNNMGQGRPSRLYRRLHSKLLIVDGAHAIVGSRNLRDMHFGIEGDEKFVDCDAYLFGDIARQSQEYFELIWNSAHVQPPPEREAIGVKLLKLRPGKKKSDWSEVWQRARCPRQIQRLLFQSLERVACRFDVHFDTGTYWPDLACHDVCVEELRDHRCDKSAETMKRAIVSLLDNAKYSVVIETPYAAFTRQFHRAITRARQRGVCITLLTNSLTSSEYLSVYAAYQNDKRRLLQQGVHLREFCGVGRLHAKSMLVDDSVSVIGSYNFDSLSENYNLEYCAVVRDVNVAAALRTSINSRLAQSQRIESRKLVLDTAGGEKVSRRAQMILRRAVVEFYRNWL